MLTRCVQCNFNISKEATRCPNCSFKNPTLPLKSVSFSFVYVSALTFILTLVIFSIIIFSMPLFEREIMRRSAFFTALLLSTMFSLFCELAFFSKWRREKEIAKRTFIDSESLRGRRILISERIYELNQRAQKIDSILEKIRHDDSHRLQDVRAKLLEARHIVISQHARYELQKQKIELIRLQNGLSPYLYGLHRLNETETEEGLASIEQMLAEMKKIRQNLTRYDAIAFPDEVLPEKRSFFAQLDETGNSCKNLREVILSAQASQAMRDVSPLRNDLKLRNSEEMAHAVDTFNIQTTLTDFSESFDELEREYKRLKAENEVSRKFPDE